MGLVDGMQKVHVIPVSLGARHYLVAIGGNRSTRVTEIRHTAQDLLITTTPKLTQPSEGGQGRHSPPF